MRAGAELRLDLCKCDATGMEHDQEMVEHVGGFADDPHTKGEAEDIGVNSLLRSSAAQISEAQLAQYGLYRPFDPSDNPGNTEVNHIQLIPSGGPLPTATAAADFAPDPMCD